MKKQYFNNKVNKSFAAAIDKKALAAALADPEKRKVLEAIIKKVRY